MHFDWIYLIVILFLIFVIVIFAAVSQVIVRFCNRWTQNYRYRKLLNTLIFIGAFALISCISLYIFFTNVYLGR
ncbi:Uncharacterised protein [Chryseobacterium nakagawai]|nr:Uncharacterised protein [Chryseobacterium nakagawai]